MKRKTATKRVKKRKSFEVARVCTCYDCQRFLTFRGKPACSYVEWKPGKRNFKILKETTKCNNFWLTDKPLIEPKRGKNVNRMG